MTITKDVLEACLDEMRRLRPRTSSDGSHTARYATPEEVEASWRAHDRAMLDAVLPLIERAVLERAAEVVERNEEAVILKSQRRFLQPRTTGSLTGTSYAAAIRALADEVRG